MPKSKSKRSTYQPPPKRKPPPSPRWITVMFFALLALGVVVILARYILPTIFPVLDQDWILWVGLMLIAGAFAVSTQLR